MTPIIFRAFQAPRGTRLSTPHGPAFSSRLLAIIEKIFKRKQEDPETSDKDKSKGKE